MLIESRLEQDFVQKLSTFEELADTQIVASREIAKRGKTKAESDAKATVVAISCGFRQNDAFSLSPLTLPVAITIATRTELDPTSALHDKVVECIADLLSRWHKFGEEMSEALSNEKFFAGELRMDGGTSRTFDQTTSTWSETMTFSIRGSEKFT